MAESLLNPRAERILGAVIQNFVETAEPTGSRTIGKKFGIELSPATIRNVMSDLEEMGFLHQPHTSAGRVPTDKAYRYYVDSIIQSQPLTKEESAFIENSHLAAANQIEDLMGISSKVLSQLSRQAGLVLMPQISALVFNHIEFIRIQQKRILVVLVARSGMVENKVIEAEEDVSQENLDRITRYLNDEFTGLTLQEVRTRVVERMSQDKERFDRLMHTALELSHKALMEDESLKDAVHVEGASNIFAQPEFADNVAKLKEIFEAFEEKGRLVGLLDRCMTAGGLVILIGAENETEWMESCSIVAQTYGYNERALGTLGIIGPKRMQYARIMALVDSTAKALSRVLSGMGA